MLWFVFALLHSIFQAIFSEINRSLKIDSGQLNFLHCAFSTLILSPIIFLNIPSISWVLLAASLVIASILTIGGQSQMYMASKYNGRVGSMYRPVSIFISFVLWVGLFPETAHRYMERPLSINLILTSFALVIFSIVLIRKNDIGWQTFIVMAPVGVLYGLTTVISKYVLDADQNLIQILYFALLVYFFMFIFSSSALVVRGKFNHNIFSALNIKAGLVISVASVLSYVFIILSVVLSPNPSFPSVVGSLVPVWIMLYHYIVGVKDNASPVAGLVMVVASILLVIATK